MDGNIGHLLVAARTVQTKFDASTLHSNPAIARETGMVDDGTGPKIVNKQIQLSLSKFSQVHLQSYFRGGKGCRRQI